MKSVRIAVVLISSFIFIGAISAQQQPVILLLVNNQPGCFAAMAIAHHGLTIRQCGFFTDD